MECEWLDKIFGPDPGPFEARALEVFHYQYARNPVYQAYVKAIGRNPDQVRDLASIPFLPISFFKTHAVVAGEFEPEIRFQSSGTTGQERSQHLVRDLRFYTRSYLQGFEQEYGPVKGWRILGLLPSYLEQGDSSLVYMVKGLIEASGHPDSGFFLYDHKDLAARLQEPNTTGQPTLLIGVTYALLDFATAFPFPLKNTVVMETGGMKGRKEEITRREVHQHLQKAFGPVPIHSEYGMTELLSQAYSKGEGLFTTPPWMQVWLREEEDPFQLHQGLGTGAINIIDLANLHSCSFIATADAGRVHPDGRFEVLGRLDHSDIRGCSLLTF